MAKTFVYDIEQRVRIKLANGGRFWPPSEKAKGGLGTILPQLTQDWAGTRLELEPDVPRTYYVTVDGGTTELISEDWLEAATSGE